MKPEEAIKIINDLKELSKVTAFSKDKSMKELQQALSLAIKALEEKAKNEKHGSELARMQAEHDEIMRRPTGGEKNGK